uniref:Uncharacterized protein n=1 Tax=Lepeophtheirus salmonis TaxID=72036 RepID=A0A0K2TSS8_LEPSM
MKLNQRTSPYYSFSHYEYSMFFAKNYSQTKHLLSIRKFAHSLFSMVISYMIVLTNKRKF